MDEVCYGSSLEELDLASRKEVQIEVVSLLSGSVVQTGGQSREKEPEIQPLAVQLISLVANPPGADAGKESVVVQLT
jgi:hypothetical protein